MKKGFTLAEMLVTLGIVGVVAALTLPTLFEDASGAQIGPSLARAVSTFEQATKSLLQDNDVSQLSDIIEEDSVFNARDDNDGFFASGYLGDYLNIESSYREGVDVTYDTSFGDVKFFVTLNGVAIATSQGFAIYDSNEPPHHQHRGEVFVDINGKKKPNLLGQDVFIFDLMNDGSLIPWGANGVWKTNCAIGEIPKDPTYCAGHVFENNLKILYK